MRDVGWIERGWWRLVGVGFHLLYNQLAWTYDAVSWVVSLGQWREWQRAALPFVRGPRVLDLAHGPGHLLADMRRRGYVAVGLDLSPAMGWLARRHGPAPTVRGRGQRLPFSAETFDTVVATFPAPFILEPDTLAAIERILSAEGVLVIVPGARLTGGGAVERVIEWLYAITGQRPDSAAPDAWVRVWQQRLHAAGFRAEQHDIPLPRSRVTVVVARRRA